MMNYTYDNIEELYFYDSRAYKQCNEKSQYVLYRKYWEEVVFDDSQKGYYITIIREIHDDDDFDSIQNEEVIKQNIYTDGDFNRAERYFLSDRK